MKNLISCGLEQDLGRMVCIFTWVSGYLGVSPSASLLSLKTTEILADSELKTVLGPVFGLEGLIDSNIKIRTGTLHWPEGSSGTRSALPMTEVSGSGPRWLTKVCLLRVRADTPMTVTLGSSLFLSHCLKVQKDKETHSIWSPPSPHGAAFTCIWEMSLNSCAD